jgi:hypothetical protein
MIEEVARDADSALWATYLLDWYSRAGIIVAQTVAFAAPMVGYLMQALQERPESG